MRRRKSISPLSRPRFKLRIDLTSCSLRRQISRRANVVRGTTTSRLDRDAGRGASAQLQSAWLANALNIPGAASGWGDDKIQPPVPMALCCLEVAAKVRSRVSGFCCVLVLFSPVCTSQSRSYGSVRGTCSMTRESCSTVSGQVVGNKATLSVGWAVRTGVLSFTIGQSWRSMSGWETSSRPGGRRNYEAKRF